MALITNGAGKRREVLKEIQNGQMGIRKALKYFLYKEQTLQDICSLNTSVAIK